MKNPIKRLEIKNFKTAKNISLDCKRINIIIGKPNVGKSNILEAISLLCACYTNNDRKFLSDFIRYDRFEQLFYDKETTNDITVNTNLGNCLIKRAEVRIPRDEKGNGNSPRYAGDRASTGGTGDGKGDSNGATNRGPETENNDRYQFFLAPDLPVMQQLLEHKWKKIIISNNGRRSFLKELNETHEDSVWVTDLSNDYQKKHRDFNNVISPFQCAVSLDGRRIGGHNEIWSGPVKKYEYNEHININNRSYTFLSPPSGSNLYSVVNNNKKLSHEIASFFKEYKLKFVLNINRGTFELQKQVKGAVYSYDYKLIADTMQRYIFNLVAIESNKESVLLFEEPEAHMFPPYVKNFAMKMIEAQSNQFFIATHSPFILNTVIENAALDEVSIFVATYENFQTKLKALSNEDLEDMLNYGNDIFFSEQLNG